MCIRDRSSSSSSITVDGQDVGWSSDNPYLADYGMNSIKLGSHHNRSSDDVNNRYVVAMRLIW